MKIFKSKLIRLRMSFILSLIAGWCLCEMTFDSYSWWYRKQYVEWGMPGGGIPFLTFIGLLFIVSLLIRLKATKMLKYYTDFILFVISIIITLLFAFFWDPNYTGENFNKFQRFLYNIIDIITSDFLRQFLIFLQVPVPLIYLIISFKKKKV